MMKATTLRARRREEEAKRLKDEAEAEEREREAEARREALKSLSDNVGDGVEEAVTTTAERFVNEARSGDVDYNNLPEIGPVTMGPEIGPITMGPETSAPQAAPMNDGMQAAQAVLESQQGGLSNLPPQQTVDVDLSGIQPREAPQSSQQLPEIGPISMGQPPAPEAPIAPTSSLEAPQPSPQRMALQSMQTSAPNTQSVQPSAANTQQPPEMQAAPPVPVQLPGTRLPDSQGELDKITKPTALADPMVEANDDVSSGQRTDRILNILKTVLRVAGGIGSVVAGANGNMVGAAAGAGVRGVGNVIGSAGGNGRDAQVRRAGVVHEQNAASTMAQRQAALSDRQDARAETGAYRARQLDLAESREDRQATNESDLAPIRAALMESQANRMGAMYEEAQRDTEMSRRMSDPESSESQNARQFVRSNRQVLGDQFDSTDDELEAMSAQELRGTVQSVNRALGHRRGRRGGAGSGGGRATSETAAPPAAFISSAELNFPGESGERLRERWSSMSAVDQRPFVSGSVARNFESEAGQTERAQVPGFRYTLSEPPSNADLNKINAAQTGFTSGIEALRTMRDSVDEMSGGEMLAGQLGIDSEHTTNYQQARDDFMNSMRQIQGMGVMSDGEFRRLQDQVPSDFRTMVTGPHRINALARGMQRHFAAGVTSFGYVPDGELPGLGGARGRASQPAGQSATPQRYRITNGAGRMMETELTPAQRAQVESRGATVEAMQ